MISFLATIFGIVTFIVLWSFEVKWLVPVCIIIDFIAFYKVMDATRLYGINHPRTNLAIILHYLTTIASIVVYIVLLVKY